MADHDIDWGKLPELSRRNFMVAGGATAASLLLAACGASSSGSSTSGAGQKNALGLKLPSGAATPANQFYVRAFDSTGASYKALDFYETVYSRAPLADGFDIPLVRLDSNYQIQPGIATSWQQASDKMSWTFNLRKGVKWSDGRDVTAADFVETLRYSADPKHAWDFTWYWSGVIKNYTEAVAGSMPVDSIGVNQGANAYELVVSTETPIAYLPNAMLYSFPLSAAALTKFGSATYNLSPSTCVSCAPYTLKSFQPTSAVVLGPNKSYTGPFLPPITSQIGKIYAGGNMLERLQTGEVDTIDGGVNALDVKIAQKTPKLKDLTLYKNPNDFEIWYTFFDVTKAPWNNLTVRQALAHAVDRNTIIEQLLAPLAIPAYGYLMPGYPFAVSQPLEQYTNYDPAKAKQLLSQAGYPDGKGFPSVTLSWWANSASNTESVVQALVSNWNKILGLNIQLQELDKTTFYAKMNAKPTTLDMGFVSYGMDYFDASNMLSVYKSGGRHNWDNAQYDNLLLQGAEQSNKSQRQEIYTQAQTMLTQQAPAVFIFHLLYGYYYLPFIKGAALAKNSQGYTGVQWPGFYPNTLSLENLYVGDNLNSFPRASESSYLG